MNTNCFIYPQQKRGNAAARQPQLPSGEYVAPGMGANPTEPDNEFLVYSGGGRIRPQITTEQQGTTPHLLPGVLSLFSVWQHKSCRTLGPAMAQSRSLSLGISPTWENLITASP